MNKNKTKKLSFEDLITVSGGAEATLGDKTFQQEKYRKGGIFKAADAQLEVAAPPAAEKGLENSTRDKPVRVNNQ